MKRNSSTLILTVIHLSFTEQPFSLNYYNKMLMLMVYFQLILILKILFQKPQCQILHHFRLTVFATITTNVTVFIQIIQPYIFTFWLIAHLVPSPCQVGTVRSTAVCSFHLK